MQIKITGRHLDIGDSLRSRIDERLSSFKQKYFEGTVHGHVMVEKQRSRFSTDCTLHLATGLVIQSTGMAEDAVSSFEAAAQHLEKQLKRYKHRLKDHQRLRRQPVHMEEAPSYVIQAAEDQDEEPGDLNPVVIAEAATSVPELSVGEAVMQLDLSSIPFVLFRNAKGGNLNVVYRRPDGNIGWVDPRSAA
jgi:ribosomal subunit interface protein